MIKVITLLRPKAGVSQDEFTEYWRNVHGGVAAAAPGFKKYMRKYVHNYPMKGLTQENEFSGVVECWFDSMEDLNKCVDNEYYKTIVYPDEEKFIDWNNPISFIVEENVFYERGEQ